MFAVRKPAFLYSLLAVALLGGCPDDAGLDSDAVLADAPRGVDAPPDRDAPAGDGAAPAVADATAADATGDAVAADATRVIDAPTIDAIGDTPTGPVTAPFTDVDIVSIVSMGGGNGGLDRGGERAGCFVVPGDGGYETRPLLRFSLAAIPTYAQVTSAELTLTVDEYDGGLEIFGRYLDTSWDPASNRLGWLHRDATSSWAAPGAGGVPGDALEAPVFSLGTFGGAGMTTRTVALDPAIVQRWVTTPEANHGVLLTNLAVGRIARVVTATDTNEAYRPRLVVTYDTTLPAPPAVQLTAPTAGAELAGAITLTADASSTDGIAAVAFLIDGEAVAAPITAPPYRLTYQADWLAPGDHVFTASATSVSGQTTSSQAVAVVRSVANPRPLVALLAPATDDVLRGTVTLAADAHAQAGVARVDFLVDGVVVGSPATAPYQLRVDTTLLSSGPHRFEARAVGRNGEQVTTPAVTARVSNGGGTPIDPTSYYCGDSNAVSEQAGGDVPLPAAHPRIFLDADMRGQLNVRRQLGLGSAPAFQAYVDAELARGSDRPIEYGFEGWTMALMYQLTGNPAYGDRAVAYVQHSIDAAVAAIAAGRQPFLAGDSYLEVGPEVTNIMLTYDWAHDRTTAAQRAQWRWFVEHAIWNVWHPAQATWAWQDGAWVDPGRHAWTGWSTDNPSNNYYYSFLTATMLYGLAARDEEPRATGWLGCFRRTKIEHQLVPVVLDELAGGGSREGTGYGAAHANLFRLYALYQRTTGDAIADLTPHARASALWLIHALTPDQRFIAPIGDHARDETARFYDSHRAYANALTELYGDDAVAPYIQWIASHPRVQLNGERDGYRIRGNYHLSWDFLLYDPTRAEAPLDDLAGTYHAAGTGNVFMRSSFAADATWLGLIAGPLTESHAHRDQGSFLLYKGQFLADDQNRFPVDLRPDDPDQRGPTGTEASEAAHNLVRLVGAAGTIQQQRGSASRIRALHAESRYGHVAADTTAAYAGTGVAQSRRELVFLKPDVVVIFDRVVTGAGVTKVFQLNSAFAPSLAGTTARFGDATSAMTVHRVLPAGATVGVVTGRDLGLEERPKLGFRLDVTTTDATAELLHVLDVGGAVAAVTSAPAAGQQGVHLELADGSSALIRFDQASWGGTIELRDAAGAVVVAGALATTVEPQPMLAP